MPPDVLTGSYSSALVGLSVVIAIVASYAALDLAGRVAAATGRARLAWLVGGALAMGLGVWSMHYIGMLAFTLPVPVAYDWPTVALSLLAAVLAAAVAMFVTSRPVMGLRHAAVGSLFMGGGIGSMHYIGMAAMRLPAMCSYSPALVALSVVLAVAIAFVALLLTFAVRHRQQELDWSKIGSALVMGAAIPVMHYTGMAAATFTALPALHEDMSHAVSISSIGIAGIAIVTFVVLGTALGTSVLDRRLSAFTARSEAMNEQEARFRGMAETAHDAIVSADSLGRITYWNPAAERIFRYSSADALGRPMTMLLSAQDHGVLAARLQPTHADEGTGNTVEVVGSRKDGTGVPLEVSLARWTSGRETYFTGILRDLTDRKEAEAQRRRHREEVEAERLRVFRATMTTVHDIVNNFLQNMQMVRLEADGRLPDATIALFDSLIQDAARELRVLANLQTIREKDMEIGTGIDYSSSAPS
jgi:PAS domain S-box-containing protein